MVENDVDSSRNWHFEARYTNVANPAAKQQPDVPRADLRELYKAGASLPTSAREASRHTARAAEHACSREQRMLAAQLVDAVRSDDADAVASLLAQGADPLVMPYRGGGDMVYRGREAGSALDWACLLGRKPLVTALLDASREPDGMQTGKALEMAALGSAFELVVMLCERSDGTLDKAHALAYAMNQGFTEGAVYLYEHGALDDARTWMSEAESFQNFLMAYLHLSGRPTYDTGDDFYAYLFSMPSIDAMLQASGLEPANCSMRRETIAALAKAGMFTEDVYREYALRALAFDNCDLLDYLDACTGFDFLEEFQDIPDEEKQQWIRPGMTARKTETIAALLPSDYAFPLTPSYLTSPEEVLPIIKHASAESCTNAPCIAEYLVAHNCTSVLETVGSWGGITEDNIDELIEIAQKHFYTQTVAFLLEYRDRHLSHDPFGALEFDTH